MFSQGYIIDTQICLAVLYLFYILVLKERVSHQWARLFLLLSVPLALTIPLLKIPLLPGIENIEIMVYETQMVDTEFIAPAVSVSTINYFLLTYLIGIGVMVIWTSVGVWKISRLIRLSRVERIDKLKVIFTSQKTTAYSIFDYIFINQTIRNSDMLNEVLAHERVHINLRHTFDLIFMSLVRCIFWFNPIVWHTGSLLRKVHEYQVDEKVIEQGYSVKRYVNLLILSEAGISPEFASTLSYSLTKNRIRMLVSHNKTTNYKRLAMVIPVVTMLMASFSLTTRAAQVEVQSQNSEPLKNSATTTDSVKVNSEGVTVVGYRTNADASQKSIAAKLYKEDENNGGIVMVTTDKSKKTQDIEVIPIRGKIDQDIIIIVDGKEVKELPKDPSIVDSLRVRKPTDKEKGAIIIKTKQYSSATQYNIKMDIKDGSAEEQNVKQHSATQYNIKMDIKDGSAEEQDVPIIKADIMPKFQNGDNIKFRNWVQERVVYPKKAADNGISGIVTVQFVIEKDGTLSNTKVLRSVSKEIDEEVLKIVNLSEKWTPGQHKGKPVRVAFTMLVAFKLS